MGCNGNAGAANHKDRKFQPNINRNVNKYYHLLIIKLTKTK